MKRYAHIMAGRVYWIAPPDQGPELFEPGFLIEVPDSATEGQIETSPGVFEDPPALPPEPVIEPPIDPTMADLIEAVTESGAKANAAKQRLRAKMTKRGRKA